MWHNSNKNDETWYLWDAHHIPGRTGCVVKRPMSEVRENELLSPATFFFLNRCVIALGFPVASLVAQMVRICLQCKRPEFHPWVGKIPWRRKLQPNRVFLPGESHGQRSLAGYSPWGCKRVGRYLATKQH